jgi:hypothetical protein
MIKNLALLSVIFLLIFIIGEWLFPKFLEKLPLRLYGSIDKNLRILAQSSKKSLLPKEYIAILGDSYAVGSGDWLREVRKKSFFWVPDYSPAHLIYKKTDIDVVSFGQGGVGSFGGIWREPITQFLYINSVKNYQLSHPKHFLVFFYEGNDIYNNIQFLRKFFPIHKKYLKNKIALDEVSGFLNLEIQNVLDGDYGRGLWKNMFFTRSLFQGISNLLDEFVDLNKDEFVDLNKNVDTFSYSQTPVNVALINGEKTSLPMHLQAPPLFGFGNLDRMLGKSRQLSDESLKKFYITEEEYKLGLHIFEHALDALSEFFPQADIKVVYIPSPLSSYKMISPKIIFKGMFGWANVAVTTKIEKKHIELCKIVHEIATDHNLSFINTTKSLRRASSMETIHGPIDWDHFNKRGYEALSTDIAEVFLKPGGGARTDNCVYQ